MKEYNAVSTFHSDNNNLSILENGAEMVLESPKEYVAYSKNDSVTVSDSKKILETCLRI